MTPDEEDTIVAMYQAGLGGLAIARELGKSSKAVYSCLYRRGVQMRSSGQQPAAQLDYEQIAEWYKDGVSVKEICARVGVSDNSIYNALKVMGVPANQRQKAAIERKLLVCEMYKRGLSVLKICGMMKISLGVMYMWLYEYDVPLRTKKREDGSYENQPKAVVE